MSMKVAKGQGGGAHPERRSPNDMEVDKGGQDQGGKASFRKVQDSRERSDKDNDK